jgi:hypothetical protein
VTVSNMMVTASFSHYRTSVMVARLSQPTAERASVRSFSVRFEPVRIVEANSNTRPADSGLHWNMTDSSGVGEANAV